MFGGLDFPYQYQYQYQQIQYEGFNKEKKLKEERVIEKKGKERKFSKKNGKGKGGIHIKTIKLSTLKKLPNFTTGETLNYSEYGIRAFLVRFSNELALNIDAYLRTPKVNPKKDKYLYTYWLLLNTKQVAEDYYPDGVNELFIPPIQEAILREYSKAKRNINLKTTKIESYKYTDEDYIAKILNQDIDFNLTHTDKEVLKQKLNLVSLSFYKKVLNFLEDLQGYEKYYYEDILTPYKPIERNISYLSEIVKDGDKDIIPIIKPSIKVLLDYQAYNLVPHKAGFNLRRTGNLKVYEFYINSLEGSSF